MGLKDGGADKWGQRFAKTVERRVNNISKNAADGIKQKGKFAGDSVAHTGRQIKQGIDNVAKPIKGAAALGKDLANAKGLKAKAQLLGNKAGQKFKGTDFYKKLKELFLKLQKMASWIAAHAYPLAIASAVVLVGSFATIFIISVAQAATPTPHYYCDTEADGSLKKTAVYQQYCGDKGLFELEELNGHYIIQDGSGPCTDCATANMMMRYYTMKDLNFFDYLWKEDGQYSPSGQVLVTDHLATPTTIRHCINGTTTVRTTSLIKPANRNKPNGACKFALKNGISGWTMSNWGYLRDDSIDYESYEMTSDFYADNSANENWVFDLSVANRAPGSSWAVYWTGTTTVADMVCQETTAEGSAITGDYIKDLFSNSAVCAEAGILMYFDYGDGQHAVLLTKYDGGEWYIIDSAMGLAGGFEGPISDTFAWKASELNTLLNSGSNSAGGLKILRICWIANM